MGADIRFLGDEIDSICEKLGLDKNRVGQIVLTPYSAVATVLREDANGFKYIDPDTDEPAADEQTFNIRT